MKLETTSEARSDLNRAVLTYNRKPIQHGTRLYSEFFKAIEQIAESPRLYPPVEDEIPGYELRCYFMERYRQRIIYLIEHEEIRVIAMIHTNSRPGAWHDRIPDSPEGTSP